MKSWQRFGATMMAGFLLVWGLAWGMGTGHGRGAAIAMEPPTAPSPDVLDVEEASTGNTLPVPTDTPPDGTLQVPEVLQQPYPPAPSEAAVPSSEEAQSPEEEATLSREDLLVGMEPELAARAQLLMEADQLYLAGDLLTAESRYRQAKDPLWDAERVIPQRIAPVTNPAELPPAAAVYWREAQAGLELGLDTRVRVPLELLARDYPEFLPGQAAYVDYLLGQGETATALAVIEQAVARYPYHPDLLKAQTQVLMAQEKWLEAAITARQFTIFNPDHPEKDAMMQLSQDNAGRFRAAMNERLTSNLVSNIVTGAAGYLLTGGLLGPFTALNSTMVLLQGEKGIGEQVAQQAASELDLMKDDTVQEYVNDIGQKLAALTGRDEFDYDFYVVMDDTLNAFALPGGKIFINAGAILKSESEAELAGLLGHEISHSALSHGFQLVTQGNLTSSLAAFIPIPEVAGIAANLAISGYSREMERQADILGTQILSAGGYAADGLHNLMVTLREENEGDESFSWFASHPATDDRVGYLKELIDQAGFNRYTYEGVETHLKIRRRVQQQMDTYNQERAKNPQER